MPAEETLLAEVPLFQALDPAERAALAAGMRQRDFPEGGRIFRRGDPGAALYVIARGAVGDSRSRPPPGRRCCSASSGRVTSSASCRCSTAGSGPPTPWRWSPPERWRSTASALEGLFQKHPGAALDVLTVIGKRLREADRLLQSASSVSPNQEVQQQTTPVQRLAEWLAAFSGSLPFLALHILLFFTWVLLNVGLFRAVRPFDPFPFGFLTMATSLESIFLACFVLISQNRQAASDRIRSDVEYAANIKAGLEVTQLHAKVDALYAETMARLAVVERSLVLRPGA